MTSESSGGGVAKYVLGGLAVVALGVGAYVVMGGDDDAPADASEGRNGSATGMSVRSGPAAAPDEPRIETSKAPPARVALPRQENPAPTLPSAVNLERSPSVQGAGSPIRPENIQGGIDMLPPAERERYLAAKAFQERVDAAISERSGQLAQCLRRRIREGGTGEAGVDLRLEFGARGEVISAKLAEAEYDTQGIDPCLERTFESVQLEPHPDGEVTLDRWTVVSNLE